MSLLKNLHDDFLESQCFAVYRQDAQTVLRAIAIAQAVDEAKDCAIADARRISEAIITRADEILEGLK